MLSKSYLSAIGGILWRILIVLAGIFCVTSAMAASASGVSLTTIQSQIGKSVGQVAVVLQDVALIAGVGFVFASFFKFHQHKLNPTQVPLSQGITLLVIGAGLAVFPTLLNTATKGVIGATVTKVGGTAIKGIIGGT